MGLFIYGPLIYLDPILSWDDEMLLNPLMELKSLGDYTLATTLDIQPIRDLSFLFDIWLGKLLGVSTFHFHNFLIWLAICFSLFGILRLLKIDKVRSAVSVLLFSIHPVFVNSVGWISARKHLLSAFFIYMLVYLLLKSEQKKRLKLLLPFLFTLALYAQPISLFFPIWYWLYLWYKDAWKDRLNQLIGLVLILIMIFVGLQNKAYYATEYLKQAEYIKVLPFWSHVHFVPLMYGRYLFNLILPVNLATMYKLYSFFNFMGVFFFISWLVLLFKKLNKKKVFLWLAFFFFPLIPVTIHITPIFVFDTYLLVPALGFLVLTQELLTKMALPRKYVQILILIFFALSIRLAQTWQSGLKVWENVYYTQQDSSSLRRYIDYQLQQKVESIDLPGIQSHLNELAQFDYPEVKADIVKRLEYLFKLVYQDESSAIESKIKRLEQIEVMSFTRFYYLGELYLTLGSEQACFYFKKAQTLKMSNYSNEISPDALAARLGQCPP